MPSDTPQMPSSMKLDPDVPLAGERIADVINTCLQLPWDDIRTKWCAFSLSDGKWDGTMYDNKRDAVRHQFHEQACVYLAFRNLVNGTTGHECAIFLQFTRDAYKAGFRLPDPDAQGGGPDLAMTAGRYDHIVGRSRGKKPSAMLPAHLRGTDWTRGRLN